METERKFLMPSFPEEMKDAELHEITQAYLLSDPVIRIRKDNDAYRMTLKGKGLLQREEEELAISKEAFEGLLPKCDSLPLKKKRYKKILENPRFSTTVSLSHPLVMELDVFEGELEGLFLMEVEFGSKEEADSFVPPAFFGTDVTNNPAFQNVHLILMKKENLVELLLNYNL